MDDLISRQAAVDAAEAISTDVRYVMALKALPSAQPQWIPVSERLPDEDLFTGAGKQFSDYVIMTVYNKMDDETIIDYGYTVDGEWISDTTECHIPNWWKVIAWMPLPEPYKGGQE